MLLPFLVNAWNVLVQSRGLRWKYCDKKVICSKPLRHSKRPNFFALSTKKKVPAILDQFFCHSKEYISFILKKSWSSGHCNGMSIILPHCNLNCHFIKNTPLTNIYCIQVNPTLVHHFEQHGLRFVGQDVDGERMEIFELDGEHC